MTSKNNDKNSINVGMIALGCEKNRIDAEIMLSIESILDVARYKKTGSLKKLIVTGCMAERYKDEIKKELPEVDACLGSKSFDHICTALEALDNVPFYTHYLPLDAETPDGYRILTSPKHSVYIKIADGCSRHCSYCVIPSVRGEFIPRKFESVIEEAKYLSENGAKEINIIAQDTTMHPELLTIIKEVCNIPSVKWVRLLYCRPEGISDELLMLMQSEEKFVPYMDVPLQHASKHILKLMNRSGDDKSLFKLLTKIRQYIPEVSLRTTFITGFPSENEEDFEILCNFIKEVKFNNLGVFTYSREDGTKASRMHEQIDEDVKQRRAEIIMSLQLNLLSEINNIFINKTYEVLCEGKEAEGEKYYGRAYFQAPDVDGKIYFTSETPCVEGEFYKITIDSFIEYDFYGKNNINN
ncbi:MAG: rimO [Clostridia bacterium]|nr:rimO [Clostridia bacterium]